MGEKAGMFQRQEHSAPQGNEVPGPFSSQLYFSETEEQMDSSLGWDAFVSCVWKSHKGRFFATLLTVQEQSLPESAHDPNSRIKRPYILRVQIGSTGAELDREQSNDQIIRLL